jgi:hypothetical protein
MDDEGLKSIHVFIHDVVEIGRAVAAATEEVQAWRQRRRGKILNSKPSQSQTFSKKTITVSNSHQKTSHHHSLKHSPEKRNLSCEGKQGLGEIIKIARKHISHLW